MTPTWTVADRMRKARESAGYDVGQMAQLLGRHRNSISAYEHGRQAVDRPILLAYAQLTGVPLWWLEGADPPEDTVTLREQWPAIPYSSRAA